MPKQATTQGKKAKARKTAAEKAAARIEHARLRISVGGFFRVQDLLLRYGVSRPTLWSWYAVKRTMPAPVRMGPNSIGWPMATILEWERVRAAGPEAA